MTTPEMTNSYEQNRLEFIAKQLEKTHTPREITIKYILSREQERKTQAAKEEAEESERIARRSLFAVIEDRDQLKEELENERAYWGRITRHLCAKLDNLTDALETAERQALADADNLSQTQESEQ